MKSLFVGMQKSLSCNTTHEGCGTLHYGFQTCSAVRVAQLAERKAQSSLWVASCHPGMLLSPHRSSNSCTAGSYVRSPHGRDRYTDFAPRRYRVRPKPTRGWQLLLELLFQLGDIDLRVQVPIVPCIECAVSCDVPHRVCLFGGPSWPQAKGCVLKRKPRK